MRCAVGTVNGLRSLLKNRYLPSLVIDGEPSSNSVLMPCSRCRAVVHSPFRRKLIYRSPRGYWNPWPSMVSGRFLLSGAPLPEDAKTKMDSSADTNASESLNSELISGPRFYGFL